MHLCFFFFFHFFHLVLYLVHKKRLKLRIHILISFAFYTRSVWKYARSHVIITFLPRIAVSGISIIFIVKIIIFAIQILAVNHWFLCIMVVKQVFAFRNKANLVSVFNNISEILCIFVIINVIIERIFLLSLFQQLFFSLFCPIDFVDRHCFIQFNWLLLLLILLVHPHAIYKKHNCQSIEGKDK